MVVTFAVPVVATAASGRKLLRPVNTRVAAPLFSEMVTGVLESRLLDTLLSTAAWAVPNDARPSASAPAPASRAMRAII